MWSIARAVEVSCCLVGGVAGESGKGRGGIPIAARWDNRRVAFACREVPLQICNVESANSEVVEIRFAGATVDEYEGQRVRGAQAISSVSQFFLFRIGICAREFRD